MIEKFIDGFDKLQQQGTIDDILKNKRDYYLSYPVKKSSGGRRWIDAPQSPLLNIQDDLLYNLLYLFKPHSCAVGFVSDIGVEYGAQQHLPNDVILNMDIKDFFPSIQNEHLSRLAGFIGSKITSFEDYKNETWTSKDKSQFKAFVSYCGSIPQGAPTSPAIANLVAYRMDLKMEALAKENGLTYTRYADDLTLSHPDKDFSIEDYIGTVEFIMRSEGFRPNKKKTRVMRPHQRQVVTGVVVNDKLSVPKWKWRNFRARLHNLKMDGKPVSKLEYQQLKGYCEWIKNLHPKRGKRFLKELGKIPQQSS